MSDSVKGPSAIASRPVLQSREESTPTGLARIMRLQTPSVRDLFEGVRARATGGLSQVNTLRERFVERPFINGRDGFIAVDDNGKVVAGMAPSARIRDRDLPSFLGADAVAEFIADAEPRDVTFTLPGGGVVKSQTDNSGLKELPLSALNAIAKDQDVSRGALAVIDIETPHGAPSSAMVLALHRDYDGPIFVSDLDETIRHTSKVDIVTQRRQPPIEGAKEVLDAVASHGVPIVYLSVGLDRYRQVNEDFLQQLAPGILLDRANFGLRDANPRNASQARIQAYHKQQVLAELRKAYPNAKLFGLGDDKYGDALAYTRQGVTAYIHDVRPGNNNLPADFTGTMVKNYDAAFINRVSSDLKAAIETSASFGGTPVPRDPAAELSARLDRLTGTKATEGNKVDLLIDGPETLKEILAGIDSAKKSLCYETFEFLPNDPVANQVADRLIAAHKRGVKVRVIADAVGSRNLPFHQNPTIQRLKAAGVDVQVYNPLDSLGDITKLNRDHRKTVLVDGHTAFVGGMNTGVHYMGPTDAHGSRHDLFTKLQGPAVAEVANAFADSWKASGAAPIPMGELTGDTAPRKNGVKTRIVTDSPETGADMRATYLAMINSAERNIYVENSFPMSADLVDALAAAAHRGVKVQYIVGKDEHVLGIGARKNFQRLLDAGVEIFEYPGRVHTKSISVDGRIASVGSANTDNVALDHNREIVAIVEDESWVKDLDKRVFERDIVGSPDGKPTYQFPKKLNDSLAIKLRNSAITGLWPDSLE